MLYNHKPDFLKKHLKKNIVFFFTGWVGFMFIHLFYTPKNMKLASGMNQIIWQWKIPSRKSSHFLRPFARGFPGNDAMFDCGLVTSHRLSQRLYPQVSTWSIGLMIVPCCSIEIAFFCVVLVIL